MFDYYPISPRRWPPLRGLSDDIFTALEQGKVVSLLPDLGISAVYERDAWRQARRSPHVVVIAAGTIVDTVRASPDTVRVLIRSTPPPAWASLKSSRKGDLDTAAVRSIRKHFTKAGWPAALSPSGLPWEIVLIEDPTARREALASYLSAM